MFSRSQATFLSVLLFLLPACTGGSGGDAAIPAMLEDSFEYWQYHWTPSSEFELTAPTHDTVEGVLQLASAEPFEDRYAQVTLTHVGVYEAVEAVVAANRHGPDDFSAFKFVLECSLGTIKHRAVWRIGNGFATEFRLEGMDGLPLPSTVLAGGTVAVGEPHTYRITARPDDGAIDAFQDGVLVGTVLLPELRFSPSARVYFRAEEQYAVEIDDFVAWDRDQLPLLELKNIQQNHQPPSHVSFLFNVQKSDGGALVIPDEELSEALISTVLQDGVLLDGAESPNLIHSAADLPLDLVLVLDYSESMDDAGGGTGIATMLDGVETILGGLAEAHRVAILEFHDNSPGDDFSTLIGFTTDKDAAWSAVQDFSPYHGFSSCWDAVHQGITLFPEMPDPGVVRALAFLSDGYDGSSSNAPADLIAEATVRGVRLYSVGVHPLTPQGEQFLEALSTETGGTYREAQEIGEVSDGLGGILEDLQANYQASYVTATTAAFQASVSLDYDADLDEEIDHLTLDPVVGLVDGAAIEGNTRRGILTFTRPSVVGERVEFFLRAKHLPRDVAEMKFELPTDGLPIAAEDITVELARGPLREWSPVVLTLGWYSSIGPELVFGDSGYLFRVIIQGVDQSFTLPVSFDNSLYSDDTLLFGGDEAELQGNYWVSEIEIAID